MNLYRRRYRATEPEPPLYLPFSLLWQHAEASHAVWHHVSRSDSRPFQRGGKPRGKFPLATQRTPLEACLAGSPARAEQYGRRKTRAAHKGGPRARRPWAPARAPSERYTMRAVELGKKKNPLSMAYMQLAKARNKGSSANCNLCPGSAQSLGPPLAAQIRAARKPRSTRQSSGWRTVERSGWPLS